jgi:hypothetical protein
MREEVLMKMAQVMLPFEEETLYPLTELARIEQQDLTTMASQGLKAWVKQEVLQLYANGTVTLLKMAEILSISAWEAIDLLQEHHIPIQMGRREQ